MKLTKMVTLLNAWNVAEFPFKHYQFKGDLIEFEGPLLVHYMLGRQNALYYWCDYDTNYNRWICFNVSETEMRSYLSGGISLYELLKSKSNENFYTTDIDKDLEYSNYKRILGKDLPKEYFPDVDSFYKFKLTPFLKEYFFS